MMNQGQVRRLTQRPAGTLWPAMAAVFVAGSALEGCRNATPTVQPAGSPEPSLRLAAVTGEQDAGSGEAVQAGNQSHEALTPQQRRQLQIYSLTLFNDSPEIQPEFRRDAARELIDMGLPQAMEAVGEALKSGQPPFVAAAVAAMQSMLQPPAELMDAAISSSTNAPPEMLDALSWVIARYGESAQVRMIALASDDHSPLAARLGPIHVLGSFCTRQSAATLIELLNASEHAPAGPGRDALVKGIAASLERLSGLPYGSDAAQWRRWWNTAESLPADAWTQFVVDSLGERIADLQRQVQQQRLAGDRTSRRLFDAYRELYPALSVDEQIRRLPKLLDDELAAVREFGLSRAALLIRDSIRLSPQTQTKVAEKLADPEPQLRLAALLLLEELNDERLNTLLADRLAVERASVVLAGLLEAALKRPNAALVDPTMRLLSDREHGRTAARVIWRSLDAANPTPARQLDRLRDATRLALNINALPELFRLHALICDERESQSLGDLLDTGDPAVRAAVAEGFARRGLKQPLIDRADDDVVYPFALRALSGPPVDLASFRALAGLRPAESNARLWRDAIVGLAGQLPLNDLFAADDVLATTGSADLMLRIEVLSRAAAIGPDGTSEENRQKLALRLAPMWLEVGQAAQAHEYFQTGGPWPVAGPHAGLLSDLRFKAAALAGAFDVAEKLKPGAQAWIALLTSIHQANSDAAVTLRDEILHRFDAELTLQQRELLAELARPDATAPSEPPRDPPGL